MLDDHEFLAFLIAFHSGGFGFVAVRHGAAVPIARARVGSTIASRKQRRVIGIFFVHDRNHGTHHLAVRAGPKILGDRNEADARGLQAMFGDNLGEQAPGKAIEVIDDNHLHRVLGAGREIDHLVELLAGKAAARDPGFFKNFEKLDPFFLGIGFDRRLLAGDAGVIAIFFVN
ncbi:MAG: hypothetical protein A3E77_14445 [Sphingopyxis sp. RIFCSPHIGHO2_12_FULL_65_19]|nr:hypothetical protein [Sphingopyxis sp. RIFCSPHIGHO2_12_FULL_65_19]OHD07904.1 MAG: hypothetical protein A3E77_14445 [Sphingopyxis sp. RIFCSPHIGHO2_12_FULL_65_19]